MQGRYGARLVQADRYLLQLSRYLHLNPVRTRTAERLALKEQRQLLRQYRWSSYLSYIGEAGRPEFLTEGPILEQVGGRGKPEDAAFRRPGRRATVEQVRAVVGKVLGQETRAFQRQRKLGWERALLAKALVEQAGLTQREAAEVMGLKTGAAVSIQLRRLDQALPLDTGLRRQVREIDFCLANLLFKG